MKAGKPKQAPKVKNPRPKDNYMKEADTKLRLKSPMLPMKQKRLSKQQLHMPLNDAHWVSGWSRTTILQKHFKKKAPIKGLFSLCYGYIPLEDNI